MTRRTFTTRVTSCLLAALIASPGPVLARGGGIDYHQRRVKTLDQAGSVHVAVLSVAPWEAYVDDLAPKFKMDSKQALQEVVPVTSQIDEIIQRALAFKMGLAPPTSSTTATTTAKQEAGGATATSFERTSERGPGDASKVEPPPLPSLDGSFIQDPLKVRDLQVDPFLKYRAANALFQEVQILNRYAADAALRDGYIPYIVRVQVSLLPNARNEPYDAYVDLSFFCRGAETDMPEASLFDDTSPNPKSGLSRLPTVVPLVVTDSYEATLTQRQDEQVRQFGLALSFLLGGFGGNAGSSFFKKQYERIIANDVNSLHTVARLTDNTLRVRFGAMVQAQSRYAMIPSTHDVSLLLLVPADAYEGDDAREIRISAHKAFMDAFKGSELAWRPQRVKDAAIEAVARKYGLAEHAGCFKLLGQCVVSNDRERFAKRLEALAQQLASSPPDTCAECDASLKAPSLTPRSCYDLKHQHPRHEHPQWQARLRGLSNSIWVDLANVYVGDNSLLSTFELPCMPPMVLPLEQAYCAKGTLGASAPTGCTPCDRVAGSVGCPTALALLDDGKAKAKVTLQGGDNLTASRLTGRLYYQDATESSVAGSIEIAATDVEVSPDRRDVTLTFPSPRAMGFKPSAKYRHTVMLAREEEPDEWKHDTTHAAVWNCDGKSAGPACVTTCVRHVVLGDEEEKEAPIKVVANPATVRERKNAGTLQLEFDKLQPGLVAFFDIQGATVAGAPKTEPADAVAPAGTRYRLKTVPCVVSIPLTNLTAGQTIKVPIFIHGPDDNEPKDAKIGVDVIVTN
jgi:hypothetical protein